MPTPSRTRPSPWEPAAWNGRRTRRCARTWWRLGVLLALLSGSPLAGLGAERKDLLIVTPHAFGGDIRPFATHKSKQLDVDVVSLESVLTRSRGVDDAEKLKKFLFSRWKAGKLDYVLLVGDVDVLPVRYMVLDRKHEAAFHYAFYPSDLYYGDLAREDGSFDDWNGRKESFHALYMGEVRGEKNKDGPINFDSIHYRPEVAVGRWPVSSSHEAKLVVAKTIRYERQVLAGALPGAGRAAFIAVGGWIDSRPVFDRMASYLPGDWAIAKRYYKDGTGDHGTPEPSRDKVLALFQRGTGMIFHAGHGTDHGWEKCLSSRDIPEMKNRDRLAIVFSAGCSTAHFAPLPPYAAYVDVRGKAHKGTNNGEKFTSPPPPPGGYQKGRFDRTGLGERLLCAGEEGAVAYFGCNTGSQPCGLTLLRGFAKAVSNEPRGRLGDAWIFALGYYYERERLESLKPTASWYPPSIFFQGMKFMLFGDPSLLLPAPERQERGAAAGTGPADPGLRVSEPGHGGCSAPPG